MTETNNNSDTSKDPQSEAGSTKTDAGDAKEFDPSKIKDEEFEKIFEDSRVFKHPRFKALAEKARKADELEEAHRLEEETRLKEKEQFKELAEKRELELNTLKENLKQERINNALIAEGNKQGIADTDALLKLIDRSGIKFSDNQVEGIEDSIKKLIDAKPYLKQTNSDLRVGSGSSPSASSENKQVRFKASQLDDSKFFQEHKQEIYQAMKLGLIEDDKPQS